MTAVTSRERYPALIAETQRRIRAHVPEGSVVLIVSKGDEDLLRMDGYRTWHFPRDEWGTYAGHHPSTSAEAIGHLRQLYGQGAQYLVFPATAAWWLDHYRELADHLATAHSLVASEEGVCAIYELRPSAVFDAFASFEESGDESPWNRTTQAADVQLISLAAPAPRRPLRVLTILVRHGSAQYAGAEDDISDLFSRQMPNVSRRVIVVDNALPPDVVSERGLTAVIGGDNSSREFSAFDRALAFIGADIWSYDFVHCATSAFNTLYVAYLERFSPILLQATAGRAVCIGHIDCYDEAIEVCGHRAQHWMRSGFFFLPPTEIKALGSFVSVPDSVPIFSGRPDRPFRDDAPVSSRYQDYITRWLTGDGVGQGVSWHSRFALTDDTVDMFMSKARAILNEQMLSIRLQALGCRLIDVTWLAAMMPRHGNLDALLSRSWREQLAHRDRDARVVTGSTIEHDPLAI